MRVVCLVIFTAVVGCRPHASATNLDASAGVCARIGQSCEFTPGKLGTCVHRDDCTTEPCLVCQSQH